MKEENERMPSTKQMRKNMKIVLKEWDLGPGAHKASSDPKSNPGYWKKLSRKWAVSYEEARARNCGNCEYGKNDPDSLIKMNKYPYSVLDTDGGGRVWCEYFDFVCHNLRVCSYWHEDDNE